jgi:hypothetical protein
MPTATGVGATYSRRCACTATTMAHCAATIIEAVWTPSVARDAALIRASVRILNIKSFAVSAATRIECLVQPRGAGLLRPSYTLIAAFRLRTTCYIAWRFAVYLVHPLGVLCTTTIEVVDVF